MKKPLSASQRFSCIAFAIAVFTALYSIGSLVYGSNSVVAQESVTKPTRVETNNKNFAIDTSILPMPVEELAIAEEDHQSGNQEQAEEEVWSADVLAELAAERDDLAIEFDPDQPAVTNDNVHAQPTGEFAEQILAGEVDNKPFEGEAFGFDPDMEPPDNDNALAGATLEFADQIRQEDIESTAILSGYKAHSDLYVALKEVDDSSAPPTETGASIDPMN